MVATDVAARGLDIKELGMVVNYDIPTYFVNPVVIEPYTCPCKSMLMYSNNLNEVFKYVEILGVSNGDLIASFIDNTINTNGFMGF